MPQLYYDFYKYIFISFYCCLYYMVIILFLFFLIKCLFILKMKTIIYLKNKHNIYLVHKNLITRNKHNIFFNLMYIIINKTIFGRILYVRYKVSIKLMYKKVIYLFTGINFYNSIKYI